MDAYVRRWRRIPVHIRRNPFLYIQALIGNKNQWPLFIRSILFCGPLSKGNILAWGSFCFGNGVVLSLAVLVLRFTNRDFSARHEAYLRSNWRAWGQSYNLREFRTFFHIESRTIRTLNDRVVSGEERINRGEYLAPLSRVLGGNQVERFNCVFNQAV